MRSSRLSFVLCVGLSVAAHGVLLWSLPRGIPVAAKPPRRSITVSPVVRPDPPPPPPPPAFGEARGTGQSINSTPGDVVQTAPKSVVEQAALTRDPTGERGRPAEAAKPPQPLSRPVTTPPPSALPTPMEKPRSSPYALRPPEKPPAPKSPDTPQQTPQPPQKPQPPTPPPQPAGGVPMPHSDQDSDLFAKETAVEFHNGQVVARAGRQIKFTRPRENLAAIVDSAAIALPVRLKMLVDVDTDGHVRKVLIVESTGSSSIDRIYELATYASWFEPARDAAGRPTRDRTEFSITLD